MIKVLITGVNGYIGSQIANNLLENDYYINGIDIINTNIENLIKYDNFKFNKVDIVNIKTFPEDIKQADILIHCAALAHNKSDDLSRENYLKINYEGTKNIINFLDKNKLKHTIFLSTVSLYGTLNGKMIPNENTRPHPEDYYSESKLAAEDFIIRFSKNNKTPFTILRLTPVYGKDFLLNINKRIYLPKYIAFYKIASGEQRISLCSVQNVVDVINYSVNNKSYFNEVFIVKDAKDYSINEIISVLRDVFIQKNKPIIRIPSLIPEIVFGCIGLIMPQKGKFYKSQLKKIAQDSIYSGNKIYSSGIRLKWNLKNTFSEHS